MTADPAIAPPAPQDAAKLESLRKFALFDYAMHGLGLFTGGLIGIIPVIVAYLKRDDATGTWLRSHFDWQIRSFWWFVLWFVLALIPTVLTAGLLPVYLIPLIWFAYRILRGGLALMDRREVGPSNPAA